MKRFALLLLALLLLPACGRVVPVEPTGIQWRFADLAKSENSRQRELVQAWNEEHHPAEAWKYIAELALADTVTVYETPTDSGAEIAGDAIRMRDAAAGVEPVLLEHTEVYPALRARIDERFFIFVWCFPMEGISVPWIYDVKEKREIAIESPTGNRFDFVCQADGRLYFLESMLEAPAPDGKPHVLYADISALYEGKPVKAENLLEGFSEGVGELGWPAVAPDGRYLAAAGEHVFVLFDLELREIALRLTLPDDFKAHDIRFADANTLYCYNYEGTSALEITLP